MAILNCMYVSVTLIFLNSLKISSTWSCMCVPVFSSSWTSLSKNSYVSPCPDSDRGQTPQPFCSASEFRTFRKKTFIFNPTVKSPNDIPISHLMYSGQRDSLPSTSSGAGTPPTLSILSAGAGNKYFQGTIHTTKRLAADNT